MKTKISPIPSSPKIQICFHCQQEFISKSHAPVKFCSHRCANIFSAPKRTRNIPISCTICSAIFHIKPGDLRYRKIVKFCSRKCMARGQLKPRIKVHCRECGADKLIIAHKASKTGKYFCGNKCRLRYIHKVPLFKKRGFWYENGYKVISVHGHPKKEHIAIMEAHLKRSLNKDEVVHHKNHKRDDNRFENLELMTRSKHTSLHRKEKLFEALYGKEPMTKLTVVK